MKTFKGFVAGLLSLTLAFGVVTATEPAASAAEVQPGITLNGTVSDTDPGYLNGKSVIMSSGTDSKVNYRLFPEYTRGAATGIRVTINLPSLEYVGGEYKPVGRDQAPTPLGVQGTVMAGGGWTVVSGSSTVKGGTIVVEYDGDLRAGDNPAFDIFLTTYNDGTDGVYGGVPEGTAFEINGSVSYEMFDRVPGTSWQTPKQLDDESRVSVISSDLRWETTIEPYAADGGSTVVPLWDRYQYVDYVYSLTNTSTNLASSIDGYSVTIDIDSTDSTMNGIIPFDMNRWIYDADAGPTPNTDANNTEGTFVGVPGEGGVLIYDITDWDGASPLTEEIPYTYAGTGMLVIDREHGANKHAVTPAGSPGDTERKYLISLPLSRQGFPNPPTIFKVRAVTDILFAKTAHWTKTRVAEREVTIPTYGIAFAHTTKQPSVVYGWETYNQIADIVSGSNAPVFDVSVRYQTDADFALDRVTFEVLPEDLARFEASFITYTFTDTETGEERTETVSASTGPIDPETGFVTMTFDLSATSELDWDHMITIGGLDDRLDPGEGVPATIKVHGTPYQVGDMTAMATGVYHERYASNDDYGQGTTYTERERTEDVEAVFDVVMPKQVIPETGVVIDGTPDEATVDYDARVTLDFLFGFADATAADTTTTLTLNGDPDAPGVHDATLVLKAALFQSAQNVRVHVVSLDGTKTELDLADVDTSQDVSLPLPADVADVVIDTDEFTSTGATNFASVLGRIAAGLAEEFTVAAHMRTYQPVPFDTDETDEAEGLIHIALPAELDPDVNIVGIYGSRRTEATTQVPYEAPLQMEYRLGTDGVHSPEFSYTLTMQDASKSGSLAFERIALTEALLAAASGLTITFVDGDGRTTTFTASEVTAGDVDLDDIAEIVIAGTGLSLATDEAIAVVDYTSDLAFASDQRLDATFVGTQLAPYPDPAEVTVSNTVQVRDTKTTVEIEGLNQVQKSAGAGNTYDQWVDREWRCYTSGCGSKIDYTLDQGYKSLGGFATSVTRPTETYLNNDQVVTLDVALPAEQFDLYYLKIRDDLQPHIRSVDIYRTGDDETPWRSVPGDAWVANTQEGGFWRIATARPGMQDDDLFTTIGSTDVADHPYYKDPWDADVAPADPVSRVVVTLEFTREGADDAPQMAGDHARVIEYMGRFYATSVDGAKQTVLDTTDVFGTQKPFTRTQTPTSIKSLVAYPYAQTRTGAEDTTSTPNKVITMGAEGHYLASIWNVNDASWYIYNGHGPDIFSPVWTEFDEWLYHYDPPAFHDELVYEFVYPASPNEDATYHLVPTDVVLPKTSALEHLSTVEISYRVPMVQVPEGSPTPIPTTIERLEIPISAAERAGALQSGQLRIVYDNGLPEGYHWLDDGTIAVSLGAENRYPATFEATFEHIDGFGDRTAELAGAAGDTMGAGLSEVDLRIGGVVNGNKALKGTTNLYRDPADTPRTLMHTTSATLTGYTPKLGATLGMRFDDKSVYDYEPDGTTPTENTVEVDIANTSEADITGFTLNIDPDSRFRSQRIAIPAAIFDGQWAVTAVRLTHATGTTDIPLDRFTLNTATGRYELSLESLFAEGILAEQTETVAFGGAATLVKRHVNRISVTFAAAVEKNTPVTRLWGSLAVSPDGSALPKRMIEGGNVFVTGVWVDAAVGGKPWDSKPTFKGQGTKADTSVQAYSDFTVSASGVTTPQKLYASAGNGNGGEKPSLRLYDGGAPALYTRVAQLRASATHLAEDLGSTTAPNTFYDADTGRQIDSGNIAVGDTAKVLYELKNTGTTGTTKDGAGDIPVRSPLMRIEAPKGLEITGVQVVNADSPAALRAHLGATALLPDSDRFTITVTDRKVADIAFDELWVWDQEAVYVFVEYEAVNDIGAGLGATQDVALAWNAQARPAPLHHIQNSVVAGVSTTGTTGSTRQRDIDGDGTAEHTAWLYPSYRYADPEKMRIASEFDVESLSGTGITLKLTHLQNEILHDNTRADLFITLDTHKAVKGFELTELPVPTYPAGFTGQYDKPRVSIKDEHGDWVAYDPDVHELEDVRELRVQYGVVPALLNGAAFAMPEFTIKGIARWQQPGAANTKDYTIASEARLVLTHLDGARDDAEVASYSFTHADRSVVYKGIPVVELNLQSFESSTQAREPYSDATASSVGKVSYRPGDAVHVKLTARNADTAAETDTGSGKAPLREPVVFDKVPEYITSALEQHVSERGTLDVAAAVAAGDLIINHYDDRGVLRTDVALPEVTVATVEGADIAGAQTFANDRHNDGWGLLSSTEPGDTAKNPAETIDFRLFTFTFPDDLGRGERIEIVYAGSIRTEDLPVARYADGDGDGVEEDVYAPLYGWYGDNKMTAADAGSYQMDMAALLHDAGISGDRGHELTPGEFLAGSSAWLPGDIETRRHANNSSGSYRQDTYYDASADSERTHRGYLPEDTGALAEGKKAFNTLFETATGSVQDDNFRFELAGRVNDGVVTHPERILWTQDAMQLSRAWLYAASEMVPDTTRTTHGTSDANFYEYDGTLHSSTLHQYGYNPYVQDDFSYAVQLDELFTVRLRAANLGDHTIGSGLEYLEVLPVGISPYGEDGRMLGVTAYDGNGTVIDPALVEVQVVQKPGDPIVYAAPAQSQEAGTYRADGAIEGEAPYVLRIRVHDPLRGMFASGSGADVTNPTKYQRIDVRVRVETERPQGADGKSYWYDELTVTSIDDEPYLAVYGADYGAFDLGIGYYNRWRFPNDGMAAGIDVTDLQYDFGTYVSFVSFEPYGTYIRGLNAQGTRSTRDGKPAIVTGDQIAMRVPTLRVWNSVTKDDYTSDYDTSIQDFTVDLYEEFSIDAIVENQQIEVQSDYIRARAGYNYNSNHHMYDDLWRQQPQTIGGARGSWFDPTVTVALPYGIVPVLADGDIARYTEDIAGQQEVRFTATINDVTYKTSTPVADVTAGFTVKVERVADAYGQRYLLHFTPTDDDPEARKAVHEIAYGQSLVISPRVKTVDSPSYGPDADESKYQEILTFADTERTVFNPIVSTQFTTGSVPSGLNDKNYDAAANGQTPFVNDHSRLDSTSTWDTNRGVLRITERLISATRPFDAETVVDLHTSGEWPVAVGELLPEEAPDLTRGNSGAYGGTQLVLKHATIVNRTEAARLADGTSREVLDVDPAGTYWMATEVANRHIAMADPYEQIQTAGDVHNSRFLVTQFVTDFARTTGRVRIVVDGEVLDRPAFEKAGYRVTQVQDPASSLDPNRARIQWIVTTPDEGTGTFGKLRSGEHFEFRYELRLVDGFDDSEIDGSDAWTDHSLLVDSYVSLIPDDTSLITGDQRTEDFIVQPVRWMSYDELVAEPGTDPGIGGDIDGDGEVKTRFAWDPAEIQILKPQAEVRVNTTRPRMEYSNGLAGDTYFNASDTVEYIVTHAKVTGAALQQFIVEQLLPTNESRDPSQPVSDTALDTSTSYVTSGAWQFPQDVIDRLAAEGKSLDDVYQTEVFVSGEIAEAAYEAGEWVSLGSNSVTTNVRYEVPAELRSDLRKVRVVVRALDPDFLIPAGTRLAVDADPRDEAPGAQDVTETDPDNRGTTEYPDSVLDSVIAVGMRVASDKKATLFIHGTAQAWGNYVADAMAKMDQSSTRSYLTPSRPVIYMQYDARYYRSDASRPTGERFGWSDVTAIRPEVSPHLKFRGQVVNADTSMWYPEERNTYSQDTLIDPVVTFELPAVMTVDGAFTYVPYDEVDATHPLSEDHRSQYSLTDDDAYLWTWHIESANGTVVNPDSSLEHTAVHAGSWSGVERNVVSVWFEGMLYPGDKIVVEFIGKVEAYAPGTDAEELKSRVSVKNNTGLLQPLNSVKILQEPEFKALGYTIDKLGYTTDTYDLDGNRLTNDRLVFAERPLFQYEVYDNFGKRKVASSDLNLAGTLAPGMTPVREGGTYTFEVAVDNTQEFVEGVAYPYPIVYDVLPHVGDTTITNANVSRGSKSAGVLVPDSIRLRAEGAQAVSYTADDYTVYVGPFTKGADGRIGVADLVDASDAASQRFYDSLATPTAASTVRDASFVTLGDLMATAPELLSEARSLLVMFNDPAAKLAGSSKLKLTYDMRAPLNAPVYLEASNTDATAADYVQWNSFVATQRKDGFRPQESNNAGVYVTEQTGTVSIGNYVWNDRNYNGVQDEGDLVTDENGRVLLQPAAGDDPGLNDVRVTLLTEHGNHVDAKGNPIHRAGDDWVVMDEATGLTVRDDLGQMTLSEGPVTTVTRSDIEGRDGYYVFSNIAPGTYRVMFEFPEAYDDYGVTTETVFEKPGLFGPHGAGVVSYEFGEAVDLPVAAPADALVAVTAPAAVTLDTDDAQRMSFDLGIGRRITIGGTVWEDPDQDGFMTDGEPRLDGYHLYLKDADGDPVLDRRGDPYVVKSGTATDAKGAVIPGGYEFTFLPVTRGYVIEVTNADDGFDPTMPITLERAIDPFEAANDNDGITPKGTKLVTSHPIALDLDRLYDDLFTDRTPATDVAVSFGFFPRADTGVIGNRVWDDLDRDGVQDDGEPGIVGQRLRLEQYRLTDGAWTRTGVTGTAVSENDGYYYFRNVQAFEYDDEGEETELRYQVVVDRLPDGYTFAPTGRGDDEYDSDFHPNGTMHEDAVATDHLISLMAFEEAVPVPVNDLTIDLGLMRHATSSLSGEIFADTGADGMKQGDSLAEARYTATLQRFERGAWQDVAHMDAVNAYEFTELPVYDEDTRTPFRYRVVVTEIPLWMLVTTDGVGDDAVDSDFVEDEPARTTTATAVSDGYELAAASTDGSLLPVDTRAGIAATDVDLGLVPQPRIVTIGDRVWDDLDEDGVQDDGEPGVRGVPVALYRVVPDAAGTGEELLRVGSTTTGTDGTYAFDAEVADTDPQSPTYAKPYAYVVEVILSATQSLTTYRAGSDDAVNSKFVRLGTGGAHIVYSDATPSPDPLHAVVTVDAVTLVATDRNGNARFDTARSVTGIDGGVIQHDTVRMIGDTLYEDRDEDGTQDAGEPGVPGIPVQLYRLGPGDDTWEPVEATVSDADGRYGFLVAVADLDKSSAHYREPYRYRVLVDAPANMRFVERNDMFGFAGAPDALGAVGAPGVQVPRPYSDILSEEITLIDTIVDPATGGEEIVLGTQRDELDADAGFVVHPDSVVIGGKVWEDPELDGIRGEGEQGIEGREVFLWESVDGTWVPAVDLDGRGSVVTDADGDYRFRVAPVHLDEHRDEFLQPRLYRVTADRDASQEWSPVNVGDDPLVDSDMTAPSPEYGTVRTGISDLFTIVDVAEDGLADLATARDDVQMDMGLRTPQPPAVTAWLAITGAQLSIGAIVLVLALLGLGIVLVVVRGRRSQEEETE